MNLNRFKGIIPALLTPFDKNGNINDESINRLEDHCLEKGVSGFYIGGSTGEAFLLSQDERKTLIEKAVGHCGDRGVTICQVGAVATKHAVDLAQCAEAAGASAISAVAPFYYPFSKEEIITHYLTITDSVSIPMIVYNIPGLSGVHFTEDDFRRLYKHDKIIGVKHTHHNLYEMERIKAIDPSRLVFFGFDEVAISGIAMGADGAIGSTFNLMSEKYIEIRRLVNTGQISGAQRQQKVVNEIISVFINHGVFTSLKYAVSSRLGIEMGTTRPPFKQLDNAAKKAIDDVLDRFGI
jgi:N-acetylneuraminate lyase